MLEGVPIGGKGLVVEATPDRIGDEVVERLEAEDELAGAGKRR